MPVTKQARMLEGDQLPKELRTVSTPITLPPRPQRAGFYRRVLEDVAHMRPTSEATGLNPRKEWITDSKLRATRIVVGLSAVRRRYPEEFKMIQWTQRGNKETGKHIVYIWNQE